MRIGLVLPAVPAYSETFFRNKITFLKATPGFEVVVFADRNVGEAFDLCEVHYAIQISSSTTVSILQYVSWVSVIFIQSPIKVSRLWRANAEAGFGFKKNMASIVKSVHILRQKVDWLHFGFGTMALGREHIARIIGSKMAVSFRGFDIAIYPLKKKNCYSLLWKMVDSVHVISDDIAQLVYNQGYPVHKPVFKITPAIDVNKFVYYPRGEMKSMVQLVTIARLHWKKGLEYTLEAMALLRDKKVNFHYTIIGEGEERERLIYTVNQLGLVDRVTFKGRLTQEEIVGQLRDSDLYIQYSIQEGFCNAVLEAQAMGLFCIVSDAEGLSENVLHQKTGWVLRKRDPKLLAEQVALALNMPPEDRKVMTDLAVNRILLNFSLSQQQKAFDLFYRQVE